MTAPVALGIDFGGTSVKLAAVRRAELLGPVRRIATGEFDSPGALLARIVEVSEDMREEFPAIAAVGVGVPGTVDSRTGTTYNLTNVKGWAEVPLREILSERTGLPAVVDNDANCMAFAEWRYGAAAGCDHAVCVTLGTGVGGGLILGGALFRGSTGAAGEIGQMSVDWRGVEGPHGNCGALERYVGHRWISEMAESVYRERAAAAPAGFSPEILAARAQEGDAAAVEVWRRVAEILGACLGNIVYLLNPEAVVVGGGVSEAGELLFAPLREKMGAILTPESFDHLRIVPARFGNSAGVIGAGAMAVAGHLEEGR